MTQYLNSTSKNDFLPRHIGPSQEETNEMLKAIGVKSIDDLLSQTVPAQIRLKNDLNLPAPLTEPEMLVQLTSLAGKNKVFKSCIGLGYYGTHTPSPILRNIFQNPSWYTSYTPYQAEISQGRLESLINFQTVVTELTGLPIANGSLLDEATAAAEAMIMIYNSKLSENRTKFFVSEGVLPQTVDVLKTRAECFDIEITVGCSKGFKPSSEYFAIMVQYPTQMGSVKDYHELAKTAHEHGIAVIAGTDLLALTLLTPPGEWGADVAIGSAQRFGVPMGFGGPHAGFFATSETYMRSMPGRIIGASIDRHGKLAYRMALQTREQHIRKEKALSNICTAQALLANIAAFYAIYHGPEGLKQSAEAVHQLAKQLAFGLDMLGIKVLNKSFFDTLSIDTSSWTDQVKANVKHHAVTAEINFRYEAKFIGIALDETITSKDIETILGVFAKSLNKEKPSLNVSQLESVLPEACVRKSAFMQQPVFHSYRSETSLMRYMKSLVRKDYALDDGMIPLGSCTMKLNAATEMIPVTYPGFGQIHPFAPRDQTEGYHIMIRELEHMLAEITGFDAVSLQPNAGSQGEYAGLKVIEAFHISNGDMDRNKVLIPASAHGTNFATVTLCNKEVVLVKCDDQGNIDVADLKEKAEAHKEQLCALMVTYPSTHGVFEEAIKDVCQIVHDNGGQVYMDGANMNAQCAFTNPGSIGADVCHLNLHKTFAIPHGGGGPGVGPIGVKSHLAKFLPGHVFGGANQEPAAIGAVSAAPWGSASILPISYSYIRMLGAHGIKASTAYAILNANYIKARLEGHYQVLYTGSNDRVAHELIIDLKDFRKSVGIEAEDVAKRLMDYSFHAPTLSFPVAHSLMIEPTESENKAELDRFCDAMISIRAEIQEIMDGKADAKNNVLKNAPHTQADCLRDDWVYPYSREKASTPSEATKRYKSWPTVGRINQAHGDRNLMCTCPTAEMFQPVNA